MPGKTRKRIALESTEAIPKGHPERVTKGIPDGTSFRNEKNLK